MNREAVIRWTCGIVGFGILGFFILAFAFIGYFRWDSKANRGHEYGYYGEFNAISNALVRMPGLIISGHYMNPDIAIEEFGFTLATQEGKEFQIDFAEEDPVRRLRGQKLDKALAERVEQASGSTKEEK